MNEMLKPCPLCGSHNVKLEAPVSMLGRQYRVKCSDCGLQTVREDDEDKARRIWQILSHYIAGSRKEE